jgi:hypothetical protein
MRLIEGKGDEPDTLFKRAVYIMDSDEFPFLPGESYHQFHNDFQSKVRVRVMNFIILLLS